MRIGIMALNFAGGQPNSHEGHLPQLFHAMTRLDNREDYILFVRNDNRLCFPATNDHVVHIVFPSLCRYKWFQVICEQIVVPLIALFRKIDILHFTSNIRPVLLPCKSVGTIHWIFTPTVKAAFPWFKRIYFSLLTSISLAKSNRLIAVSKSCKSDLVRILKVPAEKVEVIYHGVPETIKSTMIDSKIIVKYNIRKGYLLHVGTSASYKNFSNLIEAYAYARVHYRISNQLVFVGDVDQILVSKLANKFLGDSERKKDVICVGYIPYNNVSMFYTGASLILSVSLQETFGLVILEAMASGVPAIVSNIPAHVEITGGSALVVNPRDPVEIADAIYQVLTNSELRENLIRKGLDKAKEFSWERAAQQTLDLYRKTIHE